MIKKTDNFRVFFWKVFTLKNSKVKIKANKTYYLLFSFEIMKKNKQIIVNTVAVTFLLLSSLSVEAAPKRFRVSFTPAGKGHPQHTAGGAVRSNQCNTDQLQDPPLTAIVPANEQSLTSKPHPTFLAYIPPTGASQGVFTIKNQPENFYYEQMIPLPSAGGIVAIPLSTKTAGLAAGEYSWYLQIQCGESPSINDPFIGANITRVNNKDSATFWYEIAEESLNTPQWDELMNQVNLDFLEGENVTYIK